MVQIVHTGSNAFSPAGLPAPTIPLHRTLVSICQAFPGNEEDVGDSLICCNAMGMHALTVLDLGGSWHEIENQSTPLLDSASRLLFSWRPKRVGIITMSAEYVSDLIEALLAAKLMLGACPQLALVAVSPTRNQENPDKVSTRDFDDFLKRLNPLVDCISVVSQEKAIALFERVYSPQPEAPKDRDRVVCHDAANLIAGYIATETCKYPRFGLGGETFRDICARATAITPIELQEYADRIIDEEEASVMRKKT
jgi:hypothetical protein